LRVLITGATGFVGAALARALVRQGAEVHALSRPTADRNRLQDVPIKWHEGDITDSKSLNGAFASTEYLIHAAGKLGQAGISEDDYRRIHVDGTRNVLAAALAGGTKRVLHISSPGVLGPIAGDPAQEDAPFSPSNPYERTKAAAELVTQEFAQRGLAIVVARPEFIYGPGDLHVLKLFQAIYRRRFFYIDGGLHYCHPTFIEDAVRGMLLCLTRGEPGQVYHVAGPRPVTFRELGETIATALRVRRPSLSLPSWLASTGAVGLEGLARAVGQTPPLTRTSVAFFSQNRRFSFEKAHRELGYAPEYDLAAGVARSVSWYREHGWI